MRASLDLDAEIARKVFRTIVIYDSNTERYWLVEGNEATKIAVPHYSDSLEDAEVIVKELRDSGWSFHYNRDGDGFMAGFIRDDGSIYRSFRASSLPLAICIAALAVQNGTHVQSK